MSPTIKAAPGQRASAQQRASSGKAAREGVPLEAHGELLVFDINDFDETMPGPFEWDVKRLAASLVVAGRDNGFSAKQSREVTLAAVEAYRTGMRDLARQPILDVWYSHLNGRIPSISAETFQPRSCLR